GSDCKTFTNGSGCVSNGIQNVGTFTYVRLEFAHFSNPTCVISDWAESVNCKLHSRSGHHCGSRQSNTVKTCKFVRTVNSCGKQKYRSKCGVHTHCQTGNNIGCSAG